VMIGSSTGSFFDSLEMTSVDVIIWESLVIGSLFVHDWIDETLTTINLIG